MEKMIREIIDSGFVRYAIDFQLQEDAVYLKDMEDAGQLDEYIRKMITAEQGMVLDDYEAAMMSANARAQEVAYVLGVKNAISYLRQMDAIKIV